MLMSILAVTGVVVLIVIAVVLVRVDLAVHHQNEDYGNVLVQAINHMGDKAFQKEKRKMAEQYGEWQRLVKWVEELSRSGDLDVTQLAVETKQRAYVLALKKAEDCLTSAESDLSEIRRKIGKTQKEITNQAAIPSSVKTNRRALNVLLEQEAIAKKRVKSARKRLDHLLAVVIPEDNNPTLTEATLTEEDNHGIVTAVLPAEVKPILPDGTPLEAIPLDTPVGPVVDMSALAEASVAAAPRSEDPLVS